jgi:hypothetical protein
MAMTNARLERRTELHWGFILSTFAIIVSSTFYVSVLQGSKKEFLEVVLFGSAQVMAAGLLGLELSFSHVETRRLTHTLRRALQVWEQPTYDRALEREGRRATS